MMIAYKIYLDCPPAQRPSGIPLVYPWIQQTCTEEEAASYRQQGWKVVTEEEYTAHVDSLASLLADWQSNQSRLYVEGVINAAADFGVRLMLSFSAENVLLGITQEGKTGEVLTKVISIVPALQAGSLYEAISRVRAIDPVVYDEKYVTPVRLLNFVNKIEDYLGITRSTTL